MLSNEFLEKCRHINEKENSGIDHEELKFDFVHGKVGKNGLKPYRLYTSSILLYPQNNDHLKVLESVLSKNYNFAVILHDHDLKENELSGGCDDEEKDFNDFESTVDNDDNKMNLKKKHVHLIIKHVDARTNTAVAKELGVNSKFVRVYTKLSSSLLYLIHRDYQNKYQYSVSDVCGPLACKLSCLDSLYARDEADVLKEILTTIANTPKTDIIDITEFSLDLLDNGYHPHVQQKYFYLINNCINQHNRHAGEYRNKQTIKETML